MQTSDPRHLAYSLYTQVRNFFKNMNIVHIMPEAVDARRNESTQSLQNHEYSHHSETEDNYWILCESCKPKETQTPYHLLHSMYIKRPSNDLFLPILHIIELVILSSQNMIDWVATSYVMLEAGCIQVRTGAHNLTPNHEQSYQKGELLNLNTVRKL